MNTKQMKTIPSIPNVHELDLRIKCLLLKCQHSLVDLLSYFVNFQWKGPNSTKTEEQLWKIIRDNRLSQKDNILIIENFHFDINNQSVPIQTLKPQEICGILLSKQLKLMRPIRCCTRCEHECLSCEKTDGRQALVHVDTVNCYKKKCSSCGDECMEQAYTKHLVLIQQLVDLNKKVREPMAYQSFKEDQFFEELEEFKKWEQLWKAVHKAVTSFCDFLVRKSYISQDKWKDRDMDMRIVLKKSEFELNVLFFDDWLDLYSSIESVPHEFSPDEFPQRESQSMPASSSRISCREEGIIYLYNSKYFFPYSISLDFVFFLNSVFGLYLHLSL